jgi:hypothetical protein
MTEEIGPRSLEDAEGEMGHPSALDHPRALQVDRPDAEVVEQGDAAPEQDGDQSVVRALMNACSRACCSMLTLPWLGGPAGGLAQTDQRLAGIG